MAIRPCVECGLSHQPTVYHPDAAFDQANQSDKCVLKSATHTVDPLFHAPYMIFGTVGHLSST